MIVSRNIKKNEIPTDRILSFLQLIDTWFFQSISAYLVQLIEYTMSRYITIYGPSPRQKLSLEFPSRLVELKLKVLKEYFNLEGVPLTLKPLSLSHEHIKMEIVQLSTGDEGFLLDAEIHQFYKVFINIGVNETSGYVELHHNETPKIHSVFDMIKQLPLNSSLHVALQSIVEIVKVEELPKIDDGYIAFELPPCVEKSTMHGMEQKNDGHSWMEYVTSSSDCFDGVVCLSHCARHLRCVNIDCPYYSRPSYQNEKQWK